MSKNDSEQDQLSRSRILPRLRDARIRSKLALLLVVPLAAIVALGAARLLDSANRAADASLVRSLTELAGSISALAHETHNERMAAATFLASRNPANGADSFNEQVAVTDQQVDRYTRDRAALGSVSTVVDARLDRIDELLRTLNGTRQDVLARGELSPSEAVLRYSVVITDLVAYVEVVGQTAGAGDLADSLRAAAAFAQAKAATGEEQAVAYAALSSGSRGLDQEQFSSFVATLTSQQAAQDAFALAASEQQKRLVSSAVTGDAVLLADQVATELTRSAGQRQAGISALDASRSLGSVHNLMRFAELRLEGQLLDDVEADRAEVVRQVLIESVVLLVLLLVAIVFAVLIARSLNQSLRRLRIGALAVANHDLPEAVSRLRDVGTIGDGGVEEIVRQVRDPIRLTNRDEVGEVAVAFNVVHREAVRIAAEQAALRTSVSAMFLNLARRSQALVDRMIGELDAIERGEEDPKRLAQLFELDHLATRMRRNDENLLVLAGADSTAPRREDALLVDVLRAAQSEVEAYNRIEFGTVDTDISVAAHAVNDVVRLVAELLDNATRFSPPNTTVVADARRIRDYVLIQVEDRGLGLSDEQLDSLNRRLSAPPSVDVAVFRLMGLAVVSRLASRYEIRVDLRRNVEGGTVAQVTLPSHTVVLPKPRGRDQVLGRPRQPLAVEQGPATSNLASQNGRTEQPATLGVPRNTAATLADQLRATAPAQWPTPQQPVGAGMQAHAHQQQQPPFPQRGFPPPGAPQQGQQPAYQQQGYQQQGYQQSGYPQSGQETAAYQTLAQPAGYGQSVTGYPQTSAAEPSGSPTAAYPMVQPPVVAPPQPAMPSGPVAGATQAAAPRVEDAREAPIFREMEAVWFRSHGSDSTAIFTMPTAGYPPPVSAPAPTPAPRVAEPAAAVADRGPTAGRTALPTRTPQSTAVPAAAGAPARSGQPPAAYAPPPAVVPPSQPPAPSASGSDIWKTAADEGWAKATQAAEPAAAGTTRSGLPKRVPQAQLVPGGVEPRSGREKSRRTPDEVRGLLSAYHRGVQRGRSAGLEQNGATSTKETNG
nr:nitrate- and nitrite sensing domain-containing protein [Micromonospora sp. DSM 115978]